MQNIHQAISKVGLGFQIKILSPLNAAFIEESNLPSGGSFKSVYGWFINPIFLEHVSIGTDSTIGKIDVD